MKFYIFVILAYLSVINALPQKLNKNTKIEDIDVVREKLKKYDEKASELCNLFNEASWNVQTDVGNETLEKELEQIAGIYAKYEKEQNEYFKLLKNDDYNNENINRQIKLLQNIGTNALSEEKVDQLTKAINRMSGVYNQAKICPYELQGCVSPSLTLDPEISERMAKSTDYKELEYIWKEWHGKTGPFMREDYKKYVSLMNDAAHANRFVDASQMWISDFDDPDFIVTIERLWTSVKPLYDELHTYVKNKLHLLYEDDFVKTTDDLIPAHILGNMWAQTWNELFQRTVPYENASLIDVTKAMKDKGYNAMKMFEMSNDFYKSMGLMDNKVSYLSPAIIEKPKDRIIACHASAWDFCNKIDFRIKMCTSVNMEDFVTIHHEMGHIQYFMQYKKQPIKFRDGANPGFHEAIGDTIALSVATPKHLKKVGLLENYADSKEDNINSLYAMALERVAFLPFGLLIDKWRWEVFSNKVIEQNWNKRWWELREEYQKVKPPSVRNENFFDPGAKYHIPADSQYISYFIAHILEFQFYEALCIEAGQYNPNDENSELHKCDFYESKAAGDKLRNGLKLGASKPWPDVLFEITGQREISGRALLEYFKPLYNFLKHENEVAKLVEVYNKESSIEENKVQVAEWNVATDVNNSTNKEQLVEVVGEYAKFAKKHALIMKGFDYKEIADERIRRQVMQIQKLGTAALADNDLDNLTQTISKMETIYNTATICPFNDKTGCKKPMTLDPDIDEVMSKSQNYDELTYVWKEWHDNSGKMMRNDYKTYVALVNQAANLNELKDYGELWREMYEDEHFVENVDKMWSEVEPLYDELHTYVRNKLKNIYGNKMTGQGDDDKLIPAHILGNMWAQSWVSLYDRIKPYNGSIVDVTAALIAEKYTPLKMFQKSDEFYMGLGLEPNNMSYVPPAIIEKPENRTIACHASAWDFSDGKDFRIKMCTSVNMEDFVTIHHEMGHTENFSVLKEHRLGRRFLNMSWIGNFKHREFSVHIQYYILYKNLPLSLRGGANPGFHEAVGDTIALSVATPQHLEKIGLLENYKDTKEDNINALFKMALERVAFLPFGLLIDKWRWDVFSGDVTENKWNEHWWTLRKKYQKVKPPVERSEKDFDPGAKYHVPANSKYISYFIAHILEFQLHKSLCIIANQYDPLDPKKPLHKCDIDNSKEAGTTLRKGLELGFSRHWSVPLEIMTGDKEISGKAIMEYFAPLYDFLKAENKKLIKEEEEDSSDDSNSNIPIIVGGVIGGFLVVSLIGYGIWHWKKKKT